MKYSTYITLAILLVFSALLLSCKRESGEPTTSTRSSDAAESTGTAMSPVRSATLTTSGAIQNKFVVPADESTLLHGNCNPSMWANFGVKFHHPDYEWINVALMTKDPIKPGQLGDIPLNWMDVSFFSKSLETLAFRGKGTLTITAHSASLTNRRLVGRLKGENLAGSDKAEGQNLNAEFEFDLNTSCGLQP